MDTTGWFEDLYAAAEKGAAVVPWDTGEPQAGLVAWSATRPAPAPGATALVVGAGLGRDAEFVAALGYATTAFDVSATAVAAARRRFPDSAVEYVTADVLDPPARWRRAFDLVVESITVQSVPPERHTTASAHIARCVAPGGTLVVVASVGVEGATADGPPWPLTRGEIDAFAVDGLTAVSVAQRDGRWLAEFRR